MYVENQTKIANFPTPRVFNAPMKGFPMEFGTGVRGPKCLNDGPTRWSKKFLDRFSRFDTIPAATDSHPATQPPSHVAVAIRLYAKASSLKVKTMQTRHTFLTMGHRVQDKVNLDCTEIK